VTTPDFMIAPRRNSFSLAIPNSTRPPVINHNHAFYKAKRKYNSSINQTMGSDGEQRSKTANKNQVRNSIRMRSNLNFNEDLLNLNLTVVNSSRAMINAEKRFETTMGNESKNIEPQESEASEHE
jgi:hypothetical protein